MQQERHRILIDKYDIDYVINVGSAGAVNQKVLNIGDIVIAEKVVNMILI